MQYRNLGKHGIKLSEIGIGTMHHGSYVKKEQSHAILEEALNQGINFIDCADRYGIFDSELAMSDRTRTEIILGEFLRDHDRDDLVISSKVFYKMRDAPNSGGLSRKHIRESIHTSLEYLQTDYLDIYYCHRPDRDTPLEETILVMTDLIEEGLIHYWGTSWWPPVMVERTIALAKELGAHPPAVEEPPYHFKARFIEVDLLEVARYHGLGLTTFEALASGFFTGKYMENIPEDSRGAKLGYWTEEKIKETNEKIMRPLKTLADELEIGMNHLAIAWTLRHPEVTSSIIGASKPEQVTDNVHASSVKLKDDTMERIDMIFDNKPSSEFR